MDMIQQNLGYILMTAFIFWMLWRRLIAPKLSGVKTMSASDYMSFRHEPHVLIDVRSDGEWRSGHASIAMHIPLGEITRHLYQVPVDRAVGDLCLG